MPIAPPIPWVLFEGTREESPRASCAKRLQRVRRTRPESGAWLLGRPLNLMFRIHKCFRRQKQQVRRGISGDEHKCNIGET